MTNTAHRSQDNPFIAELRRLKPLIEQLSAVQGVQHISLTRFLLHMEQSDLPGIRPVFNMDRPSEERNVARVNLAWEGLTRAGCWSKVVGWEISAPSPLSALPIETINQVTQLLAMLSQQAGIPALPVHPVEHRSIRARTWTAGAASPAWVRKYITSNSWFMAAPCPKAVPCAGGRPNFLNWNR